MRETHRKIRRIRERKKDREGGGSSPRGTEAELRTELEKI